MKHYKLKEYISKSKIREYLKHSSYKDKNISVEELLKLVTYYVSLISNFDYKHNQIKDFNWLKQPQLVACNERLTPHISKDAIYEKPIQIEEDPNLFGNSLHGRVDCIDGRRVYEFKCCRSLTETHILQVVLYAYILGLEYEYYLFNILTDELLKISTTEANLKAIPNMIFYDKYKSKKEPLTDDEFVMKALETKSEFQSKLTSCNI